jgi:hypothetical protein
MFHLPNSPSPRAESHELADFIEWCAWRDGRSSARAVNTVLNQMDDNLDNEGCDDDSDRTSDDLEDVFLEIERRARACGGGYPFDLDHSGNILSHCKGDDPRHVIYRYLLLGTRLDMKNNRVHAGINGTELLEYLGEQVMRNYLGGERAKSEVFGTAQRSSFRQRVDDLCAFLGEGGGFKKNNGGKVRAKDAKLDVFTWIPFSDKNPGKLIIFTQCKTGSTWRDHLGDLNPEAFFKTWTRERIAMLAPMKAFCVAEAISQSQWTDTDIVPRAGLFLDRCRLVDFAHRIDATLLDKLTKWTEAAFQNACEQSTAPIQTETKMLSKLRYPVSTLKTRKKKRPQV